MHHRVSVRLPTKRAAHATRLSEFGAPTNRGRARRHRARPQIRRTDHLEVEHDFGASRIELTVDFGASGVEFTRDFGTMRLERDFGAEGFELAFELVCDN